MNGQPIPDWVEGEVLPPHKPVDTQRSIYAMDSKATPKNGYLNTASFAMLKDQYKLVYYRGYTGFDEIYELFDLENDPQELDDLSASKPALLREMADELKAAIAANDKPA
jgi:arylsulfatase A-like enzyme